MFPILLVLLLQTASVLSPVSPALTALGSEAGVETGASRATIRKRVADVQVNFTVQNGSGAVRNLRREQVTVVEDGRVIPDIVQFSQPSPMPLRVALLIDRSDSMKKGFAEMRKGAQRFLDRVLGSGTNSVLVGEFATQSEFWQVPSGTNPDFMSARVESFPPGGLTALYDALYAASRNPMLSTPEPRPVRRLLILLSDGEDNYSRYGLDETIEAAQRNDIAIYAITAHDGHYAGDSVLQRLADATGGRAFVLKKFVSVDQVFAQIEDESGAQYSVWFHSHAVQAGYHRVQVLPHPVGLQIHARNGYYSCAP